MLYIDVKKIRLSLLWVVLVLTVSACAGGPQVIPETMSAEELVQRAQEASDRNRYQIALQYYEVLLERNPTNSDWICTAEYEIAFIHYKQKKYDEAREELNALLGRYEGQDAELLPQQFKRLSQIVLESITEKETKREKGSTAEG
jgi:outer membrane protein assembly factor BamD (BamD/ComL family)